MKVYKRILCLQIALFILTFTVVTDYMTAVTQAKLTDYLDFYEYVKDIYELVTSEDAPAKMTREAFYNCMLNDMGFIPRTLIQTEAELERQWLAKQLKKKYGEDIPNPTEAQEKEVFKDFVQNITINNTDKSITVNNNSRQMLIDYINLYTARYPYYYAYTRDMSLWSTYFPNGDIYNASKNFVKNNQESSRCVYFEIYASSLGSGDYACNGNNNGIGFWTFPKNKNIAYVQKSKDQNNVYVYGYGFNDWLSLNSRPNWQKHGIKFYLLNKNTMKFDEVDYVDKIGALGWSSGQPYIESEFYGRFQVAKASTYNSISTFSMTYGYNEMYKIYTTLDDMKLDNVGEPKYIITNNYNNIVNNNGDYVINNDSHNKIEYGDVINYIDNYYNDNTDYPSEDDIRRWIDERNTEPAPTPTPTPTPTPGPDNPTPTPGPDNPTPTPTPTVSDNSPWGGGSDHTSGKSIWDFLTELVKKLGDIVNTLASGFMDMVNSILAIPSAIIEWFTLDTDAIQTSLNDATVSMNNLKNEVIPAESIKSSIGALNITDIEYPKLKINTPTIIKQYYDEDVIILLDFEDWAKYFRVVRLLLKFSFWFAFIYYTLASIRPHIDIGS